jgi:hypothetical protein
LFTTAKPTRSDSRDEKASIYIPYAFRSFQGFDVLDIKGFRETKHMEMQGYGYKIMEYFALKIMQKCGYLDHRFYFIKQGIS